MILGYVLDYAASIYSLFNKQFDLHLLLPSEFMTHLTDNIFMTTTFKFFILKITGHIKKIFFINYEFITCTTEENQYVIGFPSDELSSAIKSHFVNMKS